MEFQKITKKNLPLLEKALDGCDIPLCDYNAPTLFMWRNYFDTEFCVTDNTLFIRHMNYDGKIGYFMPIGGEKSSLIELVHSCGGELSLCLVPEQQKEPLKTEILAHFPSAVITEETDAGWNDYIYDAPTISTLSGKKYHGQKNHLNYFRKTYPDHRFIDINEFGTERVIDFIRSIRLSDDANIIEKTEHDGAIELLENYHMFPHLLGGVITVGDKIVALDIGEICGEYITIHIEKADRSIRGAYQAGFVSFLEHFLHEGILFVNREEDCGDRGLRTAKNAYHPIFMLNKYTLHITGI